MNHEAAMGAKIATGKNFIPAPAAPIGHVTVTFGRTLLRLLVAILHRRELARLAENDDRMLADIGLDRGDLHDALSEPLWQDPTSILARRVAKRRFSERQRVF